jgi:hypothetical protein
MGPKIKNKDKFGLKATETMEALIIVEMAYTLVILKLRKTKTTLNTVESCCLLLIANYTKYS